MKCPKCGFTADDFFACPECFKRLRNENAELLAALKDIINETNKGGLPSTRALLIQDIAIEAIDKAEGK